jgi:hypothetical protein
MLSPIVIFSSDKRELPILCCCRDQSASLTIFKPQLTLICVAGGVYDFRNLKEIYLCNGLSSDLQNLCIPQKTSREYILLNTLERKMAFLASYRPKRARNRPFFRRFWLFRTAVKVYMTSPPPPHGRALPPPIVGAPSSSGAAHTVSSSL